MLTTRGSVRPVEMFPGVSRRTLNSGDNATLVEVSIAAGAVVPEHTHPHEQIGYLASGRLRFVIGDEVRALEPGDSWLVPGGVPHVVTALADSIAVDVFSPVRHEYL
ncbi:MAG TPA: cupin domain-containing protein [Dehalococcoidia bacterium]|nr:cupin domain-containing protein [Dehalococcoidia bacterium]